LDLLLGLAQPVEQVVDDDVAFVRRHGLTSALPQDSGGAPGFSAKRAG
jgi:hypothetical protein